jgi:Flp pilus assembly protein TadG
LILTNAAGVVVKLQWRIRRRARKSGATAIEFAFVAPIFFVLMFAIIEAGAVYIGEACLQYATADVGRRVRTGEVTLANTNQTEFRNLICARTASYLPCNEDLVVDVNAYNDFVAADINAPIQNGVFNPALGSNYRTGNPCNVVVVRTFYKWTLHTPFFTSFLVNLPPTKRLISAAFASRNEPFDSSVSGC